MFCIFSQGRAKILWDNNGWNYESNKKLKKQASCSESIGNQPLNSMKITLVLNACNQKYALRVMHTLICRESDTLKIICKNFKFDIIFPWVFFLWPLLKEEVIWYFYVKTDMSQSQRCDNYFQNREFCSLKLSH